VILVPQGGRKGKRGLRRLG